MHGSDYTSELDTGVTAERLASFCRQASARFPDSLFTDTAALSCFSYDAYLVRIMPGVVVFPQSSDDVAFLVRLAHMHRLPYVARGAGTSYSGGPIPQPGGLVIVLTRLSKIIEVNVRDMWIHVEVGATTGEVADAAKQHGLRYPPDPTSHRVCTIGGNIGANAGGPHCLGYGYTTDYVLELEVVGCDGRLCWIGDTIAKAASIDLRGLFVGSEGTLGVVTAARLRLIPIPERSQFVVAFFPSVDEALHAITHLFERAIIPSALDMSCGIFIPGQSAPGEDETILYIDVEGFKEEVTAQLAVIEGVIHDLGGALQLYDAEEYHAKRMEFIVEKCRRLRILSNSIRYFLFDAVVPRTKLGVIIKEIHLLAAEYSLPLHNSFHAGDGNIHPAPYFSPDEPELAERLSAFWTRVLRRCRDLGGVLSGEHGIGLEKRALMAEFFSQDTLRIMKNIKANFDPMNLCNPGKVLPDQFSAAEPPLEYRTARVLVQLDDGYVNVSSDATFIEIEEALGGSPYEVPWEIIGLTSSTTVGRALLNGHPGLRESCVGPARNLLLGGVLRTVDGRTIPFGSRIAKDVSGYDLRKLVFGSTDHLGDLLRVFLKLRPRPLTEIYGYVSLDTVGEAYAVLRRWLSTQAPWNCVGVSVLPNTRPLVFAGMELRAHGVARWFDVARRDCAELTVCTRGELQSQLAGRPHFAVPLQRQYGRPWQLDPASQSHMLALAGAQIALVRHGLEQQSVEPDRWVHHVATAFRG